jgi:hypothetical protein
MGWDSDFLTTFFPLTQGANDVNNGALASSSMAAQIGAAQNYLCVRSAGASSFISTMITGATSDTVDAGSSDPTFTLRVPPFITELGICVWGNGTVGRVDSRITFKCTPGSTEFTTSTGPMSSMDALFDTGPSWHYLNISGGSAVSGDDAIGNALIVNESQTDQWVERTITMVLESQAHVFSGYYYFIPPNTMTVP